MYIFLCCLFFHAVLVYDMKKEKVVYIPTTWFILTEPISNDINHVDSFKLCTYAFAKYEN